MSTPAEVLPLQPLPALVNPAPSGFGWDQPGWGVDIRHIDPLPGPLYHP